VQRANLEGLGVRKEHKLEVKNKEEEAKVTKKTKPAKKKKSSTGR